jgi:hypothetical protein
VGAFGEACEDGGVDSCSGSVGAISVEYSFERYRQTRGVQIWIRSVDGGISVVE